MSKETREYAKQLVSQMTLEEKMSQMVYQSPAIERLGIPASHAALSMQMTARGFTFAISIY